MRNLTVKENGPYRIPSYRKTGVKLRRLIRRLPGERGSSEGGGHSPRLVTDTML